METRQPKALPWLMIALGVLLELWSLFSVVQWAKIRVNGVPATVLVQASVAKDSGRFSDYQIGFVDIHTSETGHVVLPYPMQLGQTAELLRDGARYGSPDILLIVGPLAFLFFGFSSILGGIFLFKKQRSRVPFSDAAKKTSYVFFTVGLAVLAFYLLAIKSFRS